MMYDLVDYEKKYEMEVIRLWQDVCIEEFEFVNWKSDMSNVEEHEYEKILLAVVEDKVVATMAYKNLGQGIVEIKRVYMYPEYRGRGISQAMLDVIMDEFKEKGFKKVLIGTWARFVRAIGFYEKNNFIKKEAIGEFLKYERDLVSVCN